MSETLDDAAIERPETRASVQDELAEVTTLLRRHRLVEGLVYAWAKGALDWKS